MLTYMNQQGRLGDIGYSAIISGKSDVMVSLHHQLLTYFIAEQLRIGSYNPQFQNTDAITYQISFGENSLHLESHSLLHFAILNDARKSYSVKGSSYFSYDREIILPEWLAEQDSSDKGAQKELEGLVYQSA